MSLTVFTSKSEFGTRDFVLDTPSLLVKYGIPDLPLSKEIIKHIERGEYLDNLTFKDRYGITLDFFYLSNTSQCLMVLLQESQKILNFREAGHNCGKILSRIKNGYIFVEEGMFSTYSWDFEYENIDIIYRGVRYTNIYDLKEVL